MLLKVVAAAAALYVALVLLHVTLGLAFRGSLWFDLLSAPLFTPWLALLVAVVAAAAVGWHARTR